MTFFTFLASSSFLSSWRLSDLAGELLVLGDLEGIARVGHALEADESRPAWRGGFLDALALVVEEARTLPG